MTAFIAYLGKEIKQLVKTYKGWVVVLVFVVFGILSPVTAKFTPLLVKSISGSTPGLKIELPTPTAIDSYMQWFKNLSQLGLLIVILVSMGLVSEEKNSGTIALIVTKPASRLSIIVSKFFANAFWLLVSSTIGALVLAIYTFLLFDKADVLNIIYSILIFYVYIVLILSFTIFYSTIFKIPVGAGGLSLLTYFGLSILSAISYGFDKYSPGALSFYALEAVKGCFDFSKAIAALTITIALSFIFIAASVIAFQRQEL